MSLLGNYLRQADVLVSPRIRGVNTPMKLYSYLDSGVPVLATRLPTHTQVMDDSVAVLVDPVPEAVGTGLVALFRDPIARAESGARGRRLARREFAPKRSRSGSAALLCARWESGLEATRRRGFARPAYQRRVAPLERAHRVADVEAARRLGAGCLSQPRAKRLVAEQPQQPGRDSSGSAGETISPVRSCSSSSGMPPTPVATTAQPAAIASKRLSGEPSLSEVIASMSVAWSNAGTSSR